LSAFKKVEPGFSLLDDEFDQVSEDQEEFSRLDRLSAMADNLGEEWFYGVMSHCDDD
jgi:hypothetical protein